MNAVEPSQESRPRVERRNVARKLGRPLKIALLGYRSDPFVGGQGVYLKFLSRALARLGHQVDVYSGPPYPKLDDNISLHKVPSLDLYAVESPARAIGRVNFLRWADVVEWLSKLSGGFAEPYSFGRRITRVLTDSDYDIIHDNQSLCYGLLNLQKAGHKVVSTIHHPIHRDRETALQEAPDWFHRLLIRRWYRFLCMQEKVASSLNFITTVSEASQQDIGRYFNRTRNVRLIPNGIDTDAFRPMASNKQPFSLVTTASSDQPIKGLVYLLEAVAATVKQYPQTHLRIIGTLKKNGVAEKRIEELQLQKHISFRSGLTTEQMALEYNRASIAVCPSLYEGFGLPVGEAMACGLPVITTDGGALPEVVGDAGIVVEAGDSRALAAAIQLLFDNRELAETLADNARKRIEETFCWNRVAEDMTRYYQDIITGTLSP